MLGTTSTHQTASEPAELPEANTGEVVDHREYDATVEVGYEDEEVPDPDSPIKFQFSWRKLWRVRARCSNQEPSAGGSSGPEPALKPGCPY